MFYAPPLKKAAAIRDRPLFPTKKQQEGRQVYSCHVKAAFCNGNGYPNPKERLTTSETTSPKKRISKAVVAASSESERKDIDAYTQ